MLRIATMDGSRRMSTQELLGIISRALAAGETEFHVAASGQHDIGGPCWNESGKPLRFVVENPGQRVGAMCLPGTEVMVRGSAPADVGWLNSGGDITVLGDAGDAAGHCAAGGNIYIGGRAGARSGSLMKRDPVCEEPELWVLNSVGSFSFEFMGGGRAVICGHNSQTLPSVLGERPCVGMVGGTVYFRGSVGELPPDVQLCELDDDDRAFLEEGLKRFLRAIGREGLGKELSVRRNWRKIVPAMNGGAKVLRPMAAFHAEAWIAGGLFGDILPDAGEVAPLCAGGGQRLRAPVWSGETCVDCRRCLEICPKNAVKRRMPENRAHYSANAATCIGCGFCAAICPQDSWRMEAAKPPAPGR